MRTSPTVRNLLVFAGVLALGSSLEALDFGNLSLPDAKKVIDLGVRTNESLNKANEELTPLQQYYLGRAFGATVLQSRKPLDNPAANLYVNQLGQALALVSDQPSTYIGYRFLLIDSPEANAFSAPGGFILITKGLVKMTSNEAELSAVLAHEIGHVALEHGVKAIQKDRLTGAWVGIGADAAKTLGPDDVKQMTAAFEGSVSDLTKTIIDKGYSRDTEFEADARAVTILRRAGFSPRALLGMLMELRSMPQVPGPSMSKTHPSPQDRIERIKKLVTGDPQATVTPAQEARYRAAMGGL